MECSGSLSSGTLTETASWKNIVSGEHKENKILNNDGRKENGVEL